MSNVFLASMTLLAALGASSEDATSDKLAALEQQYRQSLVQVRYTQQVQFSTADPPQESELITTGVIVSEDGVVLVSAAIFEPFNQVPQGLGIRFPASVSRADAEIREVRIRIDGEEYPGYASWAGCRYRRGFPSYRYGGSLFQTGHLRNGACGGNWARSGRAEPPSRTSRTELGG